MKKFNKTRKVVAMILVIAMIAVPVLFCSQTFAEDFQYGESTVTYDVPDSFWISIPETMPVGQCSYVSSYEYNVSPENHVVVRISNLDQNGYITLSNVYDSYSTLNVYFMDDRNITIDGIVGTLEDSGNILPIVPVLASDISSVRAGDYAGTICFEIYAEPK